MSDAVSKRMPKGSTAILFIQMFSTFSYAVLYSTLVLYATDGLHLSDAVATSLTGMFFAFNYGLHLLGGFVGGRFLSYRSLFCLGMVLISTGCIFISIPDLNSFYFGAALFLTGAGLNVTCINCMLTQLFAPDDKRRETAFYWNYSGMNVGFFAGYAIAGYYQMAHAYHSLFLICSVGNLLALMLALINWKSLVDINTYYVQSNKRVKNNFIGLLIVFSLFAALRWLVQNPVVSEQVVIVGAVVMLIAVGFLAAKQEDAGARKKMYAYLILAVMSLVFWTLYQLTPSGLTLFIERNINRHFLGIDIPPQWFQNINPVVIIFCGPLLAYFFQFLRKRGKSISLPIQFGSSLVLIGVAIAILPLGILLANPQGYSSSFWMILSFTILSVGELFMGPVGYAMVGQLAPERLRGVLMGIWMMTSGAGVAIAGLMSNLATSKSIGSTPLETNAGYSHMFSLLGWISIAGGLIIYALYPLLRKLIQEKQTT